MTQHTDQETFIPIGGLSFLIRVQFCRNNTWQGTIQWLDEHKTRSFRSLLELIQLINEAVSVGADKIPETHLWNEKEGVS